MIYNQVEQKRKEKNDIVWKMIFFFPTKSETISYTRPIRVMALKPHEKYN